MKTKVISPTIAMVLLALGGLTLSTQAIPTSISGDISFHGTATMNGLGFNTATAFTSFTEVTVGAASTATGDYAGTQDANVTMTPFSWSPSSAPVLPLWTFVSGGKTYSFDLTTLHLDFASSTGLLLSGIGIAHISGGGSEKIDTEGYWDFSAQTLNSATFTFSSANKVPVPGTSVPDGGTTVALLGGSLFGLAFFKRKQSQAIAC
ncbi:MAG: VPDSG-CTERM sorting domain-containing protein [Opitutaceae bacterium]|nr:VPDSG-CTERM sorting domain-containing protein [Verrucomicrobiales bacterium]